MDTLRRALRNVLSQVGSQAVTWVATLLFTGALGRHLGDSAFGVLYLAFSFTALFGTFVSFGSGPLISREVSRAPERRSSLLLHGLAARLVLWVVAFFGIQIAAVALGYAEETRRVLAIYGLTLLMAECTGVVGAVFAGLERLGHPALGSIADKVLTAAVGIFLLSRGAGVVEMAWVVLLGAAARLVWLSIALAPHMRIRWAFDQREFRLLLLGGLPFVGYSVMAQINWRIDAIMLSKLADEAVIGWYGAAYRLFETLLFLPNIIAGAVMMPLLARLSLESEEKARIAFEKGLNVLLLAGIPMCVGLIVLARPILELVYGKPEFLNAAPALQILAVALLLVYLNAIVGWAGVSIGLERKQLPIPLAAAVLNIGLNLVLIPSFQHVGAAATTLVAELIIGIGFLALLPKWLLPRESLRVALKALLAAGGMAAVLVVAGPLPVVVLVPLGAGSYGALVLLLRAMPREDLALLGRALRRRSQPAGEGVEVA